MLGHFIHIISLILPNNPTRKCVCARFIDGEPGAQTVTVFKANNYMVGDKCYKSGVGFGLFVPCDTRTRCGEV